MSRDTNLSRKEVEAICQAFNEGFSQFDQDIVCPYTIQSPLFHAYMYGIEQGKTAAVHSSSEHSDKLLTDDECDILAAGLTGNLAGSAEDFIAGCESVKDMRVLKSVYNILQQRADKTSQIGAELVQGIMAKRQAA